LECHSRTDCTHPVNDTLEQALHDGELFKILERWIGGQGEVGNNLKVNHAKYLPLAAGTWTFVFPTVMCMSAKVCDLLLLLNMEQSLF